MSRSSPCIRLTLLACAATLAVTTVAQASPIVNISILARPTGTNAAFSATISNPTNGTTWDYEVIETIQGSGSTYPTNTQLTQQVKRYNPSQASLSSGDGLVSIAYNLQEATSQASQVNFDYTYLTGVDQDFNPVYHTGSSSANDAVYANYPNNSPPTNTYGVRPNGGSFAYTTSNQTTGSTVWAPASPVAVNYTITGATGGFPVARGNGNFDLGNSSTTAALSGIQGGTFGVSALNTPVTGVVLSNGVFTFTSVGSGPTNTTSLITPSWAGIDQSTIVGILHYRAVATGTPAQISVNIFASNQVDALGNSVADPIIGETPLTITTTGTGGGGAAGQYSLAAGPATKTIMKGDTASITSTITNVGTTANSNDTVAFTNLGWTGLSGSNTITGAVSSGHTSPLATPDSTGATTTATFTGLTYGSDVLTSSATLSNGTNGAPVLNGSAGTTTINVGVATAAIGGPTNPGLVGFGSAITSNALSNGASYVGRGTQSSGAGANGIATTAELLYGTAGGARTISMAWRTRASNEMPGSTTSAPGTAFGERSDVVQLTGLALDGSQSTDPTLRVHADTFVLQMSISDAAFGGNHASLVAAAQAGFLYLGWLDDTSATTSTHGGLPLWRNAVAGDFNNYIANPDNRTGYVGSFASYVSGLQGVGHIPKGTGVVNIGDWGVEITATGANVWAVLDHNSIFAAVPEPSSIVMFGFGLVGLVTVVRRRRKAVTA